MATAVVVDWQLVRALHAVQYGRGVVDVPAFAADLEIELDDAADLIAEACDRLGVGVCFCEQVARH